MRTNRRPSRAASKKAPRKPTTSARKNTQIQEFLASFEEKLTGRRPPKPFESVNDLHERFDDYNLQKRAAWLRRPRIHTAIFEQAWNDEQLAKEGGFAFGAFERAHKIQELARNLGWSNEHVSVFKRLVVEYRQHSSIENYLNVRQLFPDVEIQVDRLGGIEAMFALENDFEEQGVESKLIVAALDADEPAIDELSLRLLECLVAREKIETGKPGYIDKRRRAISDATVGFLIAMMLEAIDWYGDEVRIPGSLTVLIRHQMCGLAPDLHQAYVSKKKKSKAAFLAAQQLRSNEKISVRKLSTITGVPRTTAARWLADNDFKDLLERNRKYVASEDFQRVLRELDRKSSPRIPD
jgi:hypothetical protein